MRISPVILAMAFLCFFGNGLPNANAGGRKQILRDEREVVTNLIHRYGLEILLAETYKIEDEEILESAPTVHQDGVFVLNLASKDFKMLLNGDYTCFLDERGVYHMYIGARDDTEFFTFMGLVAADGTRRQPFSEDETEAVLRHIKHSSVNELRKLIDLKRSVKPAKSILGGVVEKLRASQAERRKLSTY